MTVPRIYMPRGVGEGDRIQLGKEHLQYVKSVLRMKKGNRLILFDGTGSEYETMIDRIESDGIILDFIRKNQSPDAGIHITLFQALPKANKMDFIVQKATELGVDRLIPFHSLRAVPKISHEKIPLKTARWQAISIEAARQCGRGDIPEIEEILSFDEAMMRPCNGALKCIFWEEESQNHIRQILCDKHYQNIRDISVVVGPEGGFSNAEVSKAGASGFIPVSLGPRVLKVETAVLSILSIIQYEKGIFSNACERARAE